MPQVIENGEVRNGAEVPDRPVDRARRPVHRAEQGPAVLPVPGVQRPVRAGPAAAESGAQSARGVLRRQGTAQLPARRHASLAVQQQGVPQQSGVDPPRGRRDQRRGRRRRRDPGDAAALGLGRATRWSSSPADQGWMGGQNGLWGMGDHTRPDRRARTDDADPADLPAPGQDPRRPDERLAGQQLRLPAHGAQLSGPERASVPQQSPGRDFSPVLRGEDDPPGRTSCSTRWKTPARSARTAGSTWRGTPTGPSSCTTCRADPQERFNLFGQPTVADKQRELAAHLDAFFARYADPQYDLWKGGRSKAGRLGGAARKAAAKTDRP